MILYRPFLKQSRGKFTVRNPIVFTPSCVSLGNGVHIRDHSRIEGVMQYEGVNFHPEIMIGDNVTIEQNFHLTCAAAINIGANTAIAANVTITDINHTYRNITLPPERQHLHVTPVTVGENCKIYNNVVILPGAVLGKHSIIAANSVVPGKTFPDYVVIAGAPAKVIKYYDWHNKEWKNAIEENR